MCLLCIIICRPNTVYHNNSMYPISANLFTRSPICFVFLCKISVDVSHSTLVHCLVILLIQGSGPNCILVIYKVTAKYITNAVISPPYNNNSIDYMSNTILPHSNMETVRRCSVNEKSLSE